MSFSISHRIVSYKTEIRYRWTDPCTRIYLPACPRVCVCIAVITIIVVAISYELFPL